MLADHRKGDRFWKRFVFGRAPYSTRRNVRRRGGGLGLESGRARSRPATHARGSALREPPPSGRCCWGQNTGMKFCIVCNDPLWQPEHQPHQQTPTPVAPTTQPCIRYCLTSRPSRFATALLHPHPALVLWGSSPNRVESTPVLHSIATCNGRLTRARGIVRYKLCGWVAQTFRVTCC